MTKQHDQVNLSLVPSSLTLKLPSSDTEVFPLTATHFLAYYELRGKGMGNGTFIGPR